MKPEDRSVRGWKHVRLVTDPDEITKMLSWNIPWAVLVVLSALIRMTDQAEAEELMAAITPDYFFNEFDTLLYENMARMFKEQQRVDPQVLRRVAEEYTVSVYGAPSGDDVNLGYHLTLDQILIIDPTPEQLQDAVSLLQRFYALRKAERKAARKKGDEE